MHETPLRQRCADETEGGNVPKTKRVDRQVIETWTSRMFDPKMQSGRSTTEPHAPGDQPMIR
jgi:hypothetical protein